MYNRRIRAVALGVPSWASSTSSTWDPEKSTFSLQTCCTRDWSGAQQLGFLRALEILLHVTI